MKIVWCSPMSHFLEIGTLRCLCLPQGIICAMLSSKNIPPQSSSIAKTFHAPATQCFRSSGHLCRCVFVSFPAVFSQRASVCARHPLSTQEKAKKRHRVRPCDCVRDCCREFSLLKERGIVFFILDPED
jgi:hypothetical protein